MTKPLINCVLSIIACGLIMSSQKIGANDQAHTQYNSGLGFYTGNGASRDYARAHRLFRNSADQGYGPAQYHLGLLYSRGHGIKQNYSQALHWFQQAADQGVLGSHHRIAQFHQHGYGVPRNRNKAIVWYTRSYQAGYQESLDPLAQLHLSNQSSSLSDLRTLLSDNAESGDTTSQYNLAYTYYIGHKVEKDHTKAAAWFLKAALQGDSDSQAMLAKMYHLGEGVETSAYQCYLWASVAESSGREAANQYKDSCKDELTQDELQRAKIDSEKLVAGFSTDLSNSNLSNRR